MPILESEFESGLTVRALFLEWGVVGGDPGGSRGSPLFVFGIELGTILAPPWARGSKNI